MHAFKDIDPIAWELAYGETDEYGGKRGRPAKTNFSHSLLDPIYARLPARFPPLFELLVLSYRWDEVDLALLRLLPNPPGADLNGLMNEILKDRGLSDFLLPRGYVKFGKGPDMDYDPSLFRYILAKTKTVTAKLSKIDHEEILCNYRLKIVAELAPSFEDLVKSVIKLAESKASS